MLGKRIGFLGFDGVTAAYLVAPGDIFAAATLDSGYGNRIPCYQTYTIGLTSDMFRAESGMIFRPDETFQTVPELDTIIEQMSKHSPGLFPKFQEFAEEEDRHAQHGVRFLMDALAKQPSLVPHARTLVGKYQNALMETATDPEFSVFLKGLVQLGFVGPDVVDCAKVRFQKVFGSLALPKV